MPDYEVTITVAPRTYPPGLTEDEHASMDTEYDLLVTADSHDAAYDKACDHLCDTVIGDQDYECWPSEARELEPGECPLSSEFNTDATRPFDLRVGKTPFTRWNRFFDQPPPPPPPGMEHLANATHDELMAELKHSLAEEDRAKARRWPIDERNPRIKH